MVYMSSPCGVTNELLVTHQDLLSPRPKKTTTTAQNTTQREETLAPLSLKEFALENFR